MRCLAMISCLMFGSALLAQSNIDPANKHAWGENVGWTDWRGEATPGQGVGVAGTFLGGFVWAENVGWINLGDGSPANGVSYANVDGSDAGVNIDYDGVVYDGLSDGTLHGMAWGENVGWINFDGGAMAIPPDPARIECDGRLNGFVWGENVGWINLSDLEPAKFVAVEPSFVPIECDVNHDGSMDGLDIRPFVEFLLVQMTPDWRDTCSGDVEESPDQMIDMDDLAEFVTCLLD